MMTSSIGNVLPFNDPFSRVNSPHKGQWRRSLLFSLICAWTNGWVNDLDTGDYWRSRSCYDATIMFHHLTLQVFSCMNNPVKYLHPAAFRGLLTLRHLKLKHTQLHKLPSFQHIGHSLTTLGISLSAPLTRHDAQDFTYLGKIKYIRMNRIGLRSTPLGLNLIANTIMTLDFHYDAINSLMSMEGVTFVKLVSLDLSYNNITHLYHELLITPHLQLFNLGGNHLVSLADVTRYSWGNSLPENKYTAISLHKNPWHCNGSLIWLGSSLYELGSEIIYAKPPFKPYIGDVNRLLCESPDARFGTTVVPMDVIENVNISIRSLRELAGKCRWNFALNIRNKRF